MFGKNTKTRKKTTRTTLGGKARGLILGLGLLGVAGVAMSATPAMAQGRGDFRARPVEHREIRERETRVWIPDRYENRTYIQHGCPVTVQVLVEAGHWDCR